jgi:carboxypeptidase family protein/TonB-dependent receptor-like protein
VDTSTRAPVGDVVVTATSPSLQGEQVVVTDASGLYRVPQLPPGTYTLRFEKESYRPFSRSGMDVPADRTLRLNVELLPETAGETTVSVIGSAPVIDVGSSTTGSVINQDFVRNLAVSRPNGIGGANRSFDSLAATAPQAGNDTYGVSISGSQSPENSYLIDGLAVNDTAYGVNGSPLTIEFIDEVNVITGGYMPEYGRTLGGALSAVTKSGGNEFHGSIWGNFTPGALAGSAAATNATGGTGVVAVTNDLHNIGDFGATLGGYIVKDKLWFFAGIQPSFQRYSWTRHYSSAQVDTGGNPVTDPNTGQIVYSPIANSDQRRFSDEKSLNFIGKLTFLISPDHRLSVSVTGTPTTGGGGASFPTRLPSFLQARNGLNAATVFGGGTFNGTGNIKTNDTSYNVVGELNSSFLDKRLLLDVRVGWHHQIDEGLPGDGSGLNTTQTGTLAGTPNYILHPSILRNIADVDQVPASVKQVCSGADADVRCGVLGWITGGPGFIERLVLDSYQARGMLTFLVSALGHHVLKAGVDGNIGYYEHIKAYSGLVSYTEVPESTVPGPTQGTQPYAVFDARNFGYLKGPDQPVFLDLSDAKSKSVIVGGFIQDSWSILDKVTLNLGLRYDALTLAGADGVVRISLKDQWSPRIGVIWDPTQAGRSKVYANYGRYYEQIPLDIADRELTVASGLLGWHDYNCNPLANGVDYCNAHTRRTSTARPSQYWRVTAADQVPVDPDLKSAANDEIVAGAEYEVLPNARLGLNYTYRNLVRTVEDMSNDEANTYFIGNPGEGIADTFPRAKRTYHAVTASFVKTFSDLWLAQLSYTWTQLHGNYDGLFRPENNQLDPNLNSTFDLKSLLLNQDGPLAADITHTIKAYVAKEFVFTPAVSLTFGVSFTASSGAPINYLGAQVLYGPGEAYILSRGSGGRLPWVTSLDLRLGLNYRLGKDSVITLSVEGFNVFNSQRPTGVDNNYTFDTVGPVIGATQGTVPAQFGGTCTTTSASSCAQGNGSLPKPFYANGAPGIVSLPDPQQQAFGASVNPNWGRPLQYQPVRTVRFGARFTF